MLINSTKISCIFTTKTFDPSRTLVKHCV
ncbi:hypothetical protein M3Y94_00848700 [Aphelenchoides besseyi]|nr:hypothetical protein M3Y94_00848700 [Aphelenchoides besseyi]